MDKQGILGIDMQIQRAQCVWVSRRMVACRFRASPGGTVNLSISNDLRVGQWRQRELRERSRKRERQLWRPAAGTQCWLMLWRAA